MKILEHNMVLIEHESELPDAATTCSELFMDHETTSFQFDEYGREPYGDHRICGTSVTWDDHPRSYYIPVRHNVDGDLVPGNLPIENYQRWHRDVLRNQNLKRWVNQSIKFDMHFSLAEGAEIPRIGGPEIYCTEVHSKLLDTDRLTKGGYGLDALAKWLLDRDISKYEVALKQHLTSLNLRKHCKDYGHAAIGVMAPYACCDTLTVRDVARKLEEFCPEQCKPVWQYETLLTPVLFDMERDGERVDEELLAIRELELTVQLAKIEEEIHTHTGQRCQPSKSKDCFELLCAKYGLPVLSWSQDKEETGDEVGSPSFDFDALTQYSGLPEVLENPLLKWVVSAMLDYRDKHTLLTYFVQPYSRLHVNGLMHPDYDQIKRTGRLGCRKPNMQQLSKEAKELIIPGAGRGFLCCDYSQIEFRLLVHYMNDPTAVAAYQNNPDTDFHQWVADMCGIDRKPAKNVNFCMGYQGGKRKVVRMLSSDPKIVDVLGVEADVVCAGSRIPDELYVFICDVVRRGGDQRFREDPRLVAIAKQLVAKAEGISPADRPAIFSMLCKRRGEEVYNRYHATLPGLKRESRAAASACAANGYVACPDKRRRHLPPRASWLAMNSVTQGWAASIIKERTVALAPRYNSETRALGLSLAAQVHDENRFVGEVEALRNPSAIRHVTSIMERPLTSIRVPIRSSASFSAVNWREASDDKHPKYEKLEIVRSLPASQDPNLPQKWLSHTASQVEPGGVR